MSVEVRDLVLRRGTFELRVGAFEAASGELTTVVGPNGAGKTTLLRCIAGLLEAAEGRVFVQARDTAGLRDAERARLLSYVPQEHNAVFNYAVQDFVLMGRAAYLSLFAMPSAADLRVVQEALHYVGLEDFAARPYFELSSGERRLILIARALAQQSEVLLLDEPTSFLDPRHELELMDLTRRLAVEKGKTVVMTLHSLDMAVKYSDRLVFMKSGGVHAAGRPGEVLSDDLLESVYDVKMRIVDFDGRKVILR